MRRRQATYILSIPTVSALSAEHRRLIESILRRRSDGPVIVKERRVTTAGGESFAQTKALWAIFEDRRAAELAREDLETVFFHLQVVERLEWRRPRASREAPCSCVLTGARYGGAYYSGVRHCERHSSLVVHGQEEPERLTGCEPVRLVPLARQEETQPAGRQAHAASRPSLGRRRPVRDVRILALRAASGQ
jgi:hypothetical protein